MGKRHILKMFITKNIVSLLIGVLALQIVDCKYRIMRSPDKMELNLPNYSAEREDKGNEIHDKMDEEGQYWERERETYKEKEEDRIEKAKEDRETNNEQNHQKYDDEKQHQQQQQEAYNKELNDSYNNDRENLESHYDADNEHYHGHGNDMNNNEHIGEPAAAATDLNDKGERYEEQGSEYANNRQDDVENYEIEGKGPSFSYNKE